MLECLALDKMKLAIVAVLVCFSLCVSGQQRPRPGPPGPPGPPRPPGPPGPPRPRPRKGPATAQEINQLLGNGLRHLDEERLRREPIRIGKLNSTVVQSDSLNVTVNIERGVQWLGRTKRVAPSTTRTNSSLELSLEIDQEDITIRGDITIKGTVNGNETEQSGRIAIRTASAAMSASLKADLTRESVTVTDLSIANSASAANVNITETELDESDLETIQDAIAEEIARLIAEGQKIVEENKDKAIAGLNKLAEGKNLEEILDKLERHRGPPGPPGPPGPRPGPPRPQSGFEDQLISLFSL